ncbi:hypothetical protein K7G19_07435 [Cupriavidus sp. DB3]|uniref:hypothetical protein n=1 Tax=Cupriavidus sp. DB3 TaxID=2873259 RepID=UPI001CF17B82|nr:hypothetical protein [Cupriavidus sp. DB3]MCA7083431.1 hypothetical protein [Cupriavidus sp. DB3]
MTNDMLDMAYINSLPQPFVGRTLDSSWWPIYDFDVQTGLLRIDACGLLQVMHIADFTAFRDDNGVEHEADDFYVDGDRAIAALTGSQQ